MRAGGLVLVVVCGCGLLEISARGGLGGGDIGIWLDDILAPVLGDMGAWVVLLALWMTGITLVTGLSWVGLTQATGHLTLRGLGWLWNGVYSGLVALFSLVGRRERSPTRGRGRAKIARPVRKRRAAAAAAPKRPRKIEPDMPVKPATGGDLPSLSLLSDPPPETSLQSESVLRDQARRLEEKLQEFRRGAPPWSRCLQGPVRGRCFEVQPAAGIRASRITSLASDLARSLMAHSVRVVESMPGKSTVGLEIANNERMLVTLGEILRSGTYARANSNLTLGLGKDIAGHPVVDDLQKMPHLLVAGATGSGKSVAINAMVPEPALQNPRPKRCG